MINPCISCAIGFEDSCYCEKKSAYEAYQQGKTETKADIIKECHYLLDCGMGKKKSIEHLIKILEKE